MPNRSLRVCSTPGCPGLVVGRGGKCPACAKQYERRRGTAKGRGYGAEWRRARAEHLARHPICVDPYGRHNQRGERVAATVVDHVVPKRRGGRDDPRNYQSLCASCHTEKIARETGVRGMGI